MITKDMELHFEIIGHQIHTAGEDREQLIEDLGLTPEEAEELAVAYVAYSQDKS